MAIEPVQSGAPSDGHGIVVWLDEVADASGIPSAAEVNAGERITYGLTGDGFVHEVTVNERTSTRYTLEQELTATGTTKHKLTVKYVYDRETPNDTQVLFGTRGVEGVIVHALGYPNDHVFEGGDLVNAVLPIRTGVSTDVPPTANTDLAKQQVPEIIGTVHQEVALLAA